MGCFSEDVHLRVDLHAEALVHGLLDLPGKGEHLAARGAAAVHEHQGLTLVDADVSSLRPFQPARSMSHPAASFTRPSGAG